MAQLPFDVVLRGVLVQRFLRLVFRPRNRLIKRPLLYVSRSRTGSFSWIWGDGNKSGGRGVRPSRRTFGACQEPVD